MKAVGESTHFRVFGHFLHLFYSLRDKHRNRIGGRQSRESGRHWINDLTHTHTHKKKKQQDVN